MIRRAALILASTALILSGISITSSPARAEGPVQQLVNEVLSHVPGSPHCC